MATLVQVKKKGMYSYYSMQTKVTMPYLRNGFRNEFNKFDMRIIMLLGSSGCGKTTTLNLVDQELRARGAQSTNRVQQGGNINDFSDRLIFNGQRIGYLTMGDYSRVILQCWDQFEQQQCDLFITACNDRFVKPVRRLNSYAHNVVRKTRNSDRLSMDSADFGVSQDIISLI